MRSDGQTDMKLIVAFRNFANVPKNAHVREGIDQRNSLWVV